ncbi:MAG: FxDxF family PEP-CTERM protein [Thiobacillus sp.]|nr:FxDxF family PEP-CTERM protein [Thiobacillus sp.]
MKHLALAVSLAAAFAAGNAQAIVVTQWNFNSPTPDGNTGTGTLLPAIGTGTASLVGGVTATFASGDASGGSSDPATGDDSGWNTSTYAAQGTGDKTRGVQFNVSTVGFNNVVINYDLRHSNTSSRYEQFQYSTDGVNFVDFAQFDGNAGDTWFNGRSVDLSGVASVNNNANFAFRVVSTFAPSTSGYVASNPSSSYSTSGTWRFDMVTLNAAPVPEAETYAMMLAGLGLVGFMAARRRKA